VTEPHGEPARAPADERSSVLTPAARLPDEWLAWMAEHGERPFRARQVFRWIHVRGVHDPRQMTDVPAGLRDRLAEAGLGPPLSVASVRRARDGTRKLLCDLARGGVIECVLIPMTDRPEDEDADAAAVDEDGEDTPEPPLRRVTLCVSTQVGCAMGCVFCASGRAGLTRGLGAEEVVAQVLTAREHLDPGEYLRNIVFMGMGEPLHHYDQTARAIRLIAHTDGIAMSPRRVTVSTVGLIPGIERLGADFEGKVGLAISLHAPTTEMRDRIIPINRRYPLPDLLAALRRYPLPRRRRITIEYTLIAGENDEVSHARALASLLSGLRVKVNLIPMNPVAGAGYAPPDPARVDRFRQVLTDAGLSCFVRKRRGDEVDAACGQLALARPFSGDRHVPEGPRRQSG
jgi:23S rRNA (adenine2503-C2)-methyltransferase